MSAKKQIVTVPIKDLKKKVFVREMINADHAIFLGELLENGTTLPPIRVTPDFTVIDGRHRIEAYELNRRTEIEAEIVEVKDETDIIAIAYKANSGGALPPTPQDTEHTVMLLIDRGVSAKQIAALLGLPSGMVRRYVKEVRSKVSRQKLQQAAAAVADGGLTAAKAAEQYGVDLENLRQILLGRRRKHKGGVAEIQRQLTYTYKSLGAKNSARLKRLMESYGDGDVTTKQVRAILTHLEQLQKQSSRRLADWKKRFDAVNGNTNDKADKAVAAL